MAFDNQAAGFLTKEYSSVNRRVSRASNADVSSINVCRINKVNPDDLTADIFIPELSKIVQGVPLSFPSKGKEFGAFFMPKEGQLCLVITTQFGRMFVLSSSSISKNSIEEKIFPGENVIKSEQGATFRQDLWGSSIITAKNGNTLSVDDSFVNNSISMGVQELTISSKLLKGLPVDINYLPWNTAVNKQYSSPVNYEEFYSDIEGLKSYNISDILTSGDINKSVSDIILTDMDSVKSLAADFSDVLDDFSSRIDTANTQIEIAALKDEFKQKIKDQFKISKKPCLVVQKGNVTTKKPRDLDDIASLSDEDFEKSPEGNRLVLKLSILDSDTQAENATISIDSKGIARLKFKKLIIDAPEGCIINGNNY
jgi:hypothetical protein